MEWMQQLKSKYIEVPHEYLYVRTEDVERLINGDSALAYVSVDNHSDHTLISTFKLQPAIKVDDNTYDIVFIFI